MEPECPRTATGSRRWLPSLLLLTIALPAIAAVTGCADEAPSPSPGEPAAPAGAAEDSNDRFVAREGIGVDFLHRRFTTPEKKYLPETAGSGLALLDADGDGRLDIYAVQCCPLPGYPDPPPAPENKLYRATGPWAYEDVTEEAGVGDTGYGMGATAPDLDDDGDPDLYVTNLVANVLYRNDGGRFEDVTAASGLASPTWSTAAGWADFDRDGDLDLYLANYAVIDFETYTACSDKVNGERVLSYCHPDSLEFAADQVFRNDGGLVFTEVTAEAGVVDDCGKGLAVVPFDHDSDGWVDLFVANDCNENFCWRNTGEGIGFENIAFDVQLDVDARGRTQACMGTDVGDIDGDGDFDLISANFGKEANVLYVRNEQGFYDDRIQRAGMGETSYNVTGFGTEFFDHDNDGDLDLMVVNGHIVDIVDLLSTSETFLQPAHFYENVGEGRFVECGAAMGGWFPKERLGRGLAVGDLDDDGDLDVVVSCNNEPLSLLENRVGQDRRWIGLELQGTRSPRDAIGARVHLRCGDFEQVEEIRGSSSYLSWVDLRLFFGLGERDEPCQARIRWPSGVETVHEQLEVGRVHRFVEPED